MNNVNISLIWEPIEFLHQGKYREQLKLNHWGLFGRIRVGAEF